MKIHFYETEFQEQKSKEFTFMKHCVSQKKRNPILCYD